MVKRVFWVALGASVGVVAVNRATRAARRLAPAAVAETAAGVPGRISSAWQEFTGDVRSAAAEREFELYHTLGVDTAQYEK
jgi:hypothetical protein